MLMKPRLRVLKDKYALETGQHWICSHAGVCARGETPEEAYHALFTHFELLMRRPQFTSSRIRA